VLVASTIQRSPSRTGCFLDAAELRAAPLDLELGDREVGEQLTHDGVVVAAVEVHRADIVEQTGQRDGTQRGFEHADVVAVRAVDRPGDRDAVTFGGHRPLPAQLGSITRVRARSLTAARCLLQRPVERDVVKIESDDPIERGERFGGERIDTPAAIHSSRRARNVVSDTV
jgi:hypothetical protein